MKKYAFSWIGVFLMLVFICSIVGVSSCSSSGISSVMKAKIDSMQIVLKSNADGAGTLVKNLQIFDTLDYTVFSNQERVRLYESHSHDIKVNWPDGHFTTGVNKHIEDLKAMFVYAPETRIKQHPIRFGNCTGEWTCVTDVFMGTFTKPMPMRTVGHWKNGVMIEESLFWDNQIYMNQIGLGK